MDVQVTKFSTLYYLYGWNNHDTYYSKLCGFINLLQCSRGHSDHLLGSPTRKHPGKGGKSTSCIVHRHKVCYIVVRLIVT